MSSTDVTGQTRPFSTPLSPACIRRNNTDVGGRGEATPLPRGRERFPPLCKSEPEEILCVKLDSSNWMASRHKKVQRGWNLWAVTHIINSNEYLFFFSYSLQCKNPDHRIVNALLQPRTTHPEWDSRLQVGAQPRAGLCLPRSQHTKRRVFFFPQKSHLLRKFSCALRVQQDRGV